jgi:hypothetical protein
MVVARFREDVRWIQASTNHTTRLLIYDKSSGNYGRESVSYLRFILENIRSDLEDDHLACFTQGSLAGKQTRALETGYLSTPIPGPLRTTVPEHAEAGEALPRVADSGTIHIEDVLQMPPSLWALGRGGGRDETCPREEDEALQRNSWLAHLPK